MNKFLVLFLFVITSKTIIAQSKKDTSFKIMESKIFLSQKAAKQIADSAEKCAVKNKWTVSIAIVNEAGQLIYFTKMDESTNASGDIAIAKARHSAYYRRDTKFHEDLLTKGNNLVLALPNTMPVEGGIQLIYQGKTIGAIGVSGAASTDDGKIAKAGADVLIAIKQ